MDLVEGVWTPVYVPYNLCVKTKELGLLEELVPGAPPKSTNADHHNLTEHVFCLNALLTIWGGQEGVMITCLPPAPYLFSQLCFNL